ncbi:MAG TPA: peptidoglycan DD-metalloendopeptidase family protein [Sandaracinaceae bacterium LLY-WYZ-13_1]|nr:peptidoglycan DD-metalloendopeptidase family protein [Sandaracinaceae bacterium LLY-WYZ-13_1]
MTSRPTTPGSATTGARWPTGLCAVVAITILLAGGSAPASGQPLSLAAHGAEEAAAEPASDALGAALGRMEEATARRARVDTELEALVSQRDAARRRLRTRIRALYRMQRAGMLPLAGGFEALLRHRARVERLERMVEHDLSGLRTLRRRVGALRARASRVAGEVERAEARVGALRAREESRERELETLSRMIEDPAAWSGPSSTFGVRPSGGSAAAPSFVEARGSLPLPVGGSATLRDAEREGGAGLELSASPGVTVRAVGAGRVAFAAPHPAYGRLVIVDHGGGFYTVYGGLGAVAVSVGASVARDAVLGTVGDRAVFFQVRRGTRPLPAREWLGI